MLTLVIGYLSQPILAGTMVVTGANSGLGQAMVSKLVDEGHDVILMARNEAKLIETQKAYQAKGHAVSCYAFDYKDTAKINQVSEIIKAKQIDISGLVIITPRPVLDDNIMPTPDAWQAMVNEGFIGPLEVIKNLEPQMASGSKIVIISGITSKELLPNHASYGILRTMWLAQAKGLSHHLGAKQIHVNTLSPGGVLTEGFKAKLNQRAIKQGRSFEEQLAVEVENIPLHKYAQPEEVANTVSFLLSPNSNHISGANITFDGGFTKSY